MALHGGWVDVGEVRDAGEEGEDWRQRAIIVSVDDQLKR